QEDQLVAGPSPGRHRSEVRGVELLRNHAVILSASTDGLLRFTERAEGKILGEVKVQGERLTSVHITPGGEFMVVGDSDASMPLWALRLLDVPLLLARPFAQALPIHLPAVNALVADPHVPAGLGPALRYIQTVLQHRFRYDVEVAEMPSIQAGEFDIEIA